MTLEKCLSSQLPRLKPRFDIPNEIILGFNSSVSPEKQASCFQCLEKLNLPTLALPRINILRVTFGAYGLLISAKNMLAVGGMEMELMELDKALAKSYPVDIHVLSRSMNNHTKVEDSNCAESLGNTYFQAVPNFGRFRQVTMEALKQELDKKNFDLIHMHYVHVQRPSFDGVFEEAKRRDIPIIATNHTCVGPQKYKVNKIQKFANFTKYVSELVEECGLIRAFQLRYNEWRERQKPVSSLLPKLNDILKFRSPIFQHSPLVAVSKYAQDQFKGQPSIVIGSAIDIDYFNPSLVKPEEKVSIKQELNLPNDKKIITYHARICEGKGQIALVEVAKELLSKYGEDFHFALIGTIQDSKYFNLIKQQLSELGLASFFTIQPALNAQGIRALLSVSSAFVFPTRYEALGRSAIEAILMGVPVVANNVGGIPEYIKDQETGLLVELDNCEQMAGALKRLLADLQLRSKIVRDANILCREKYCAKRLAKDYIELVYGPLIVNHSLDHTSEINGREKLPILK